MCSTYKPKLSFGPLLTLLFDLAGRRVVTDASLYMLCTSVKQMFGFLTLTLDYVTKLCIRSFLMSVLFSINYIHFPLPVVYDIFCHSDFVKKEEVIFLLLMPPCCPLLPPLCLTAQPDLSTATLGTTDSIQ